VRGEDAAIHTHRKVGEAVRATIQKLGGVMPEDLRPERSIKNLAAKTAAKRIGRTPKALPPASPKN